MTYKCLCCGKRLRGVMTNNFDTDYKDPPDGGVCFTTRGNYGSGLIDNLHHETMIEIVICDGCLSKNRRRLNTVQAIQDIRYLVKRGLKI